MYTYVDVCVHIFVKHMYIHAYMHAFVCVYIRAARQLAQCHLEFLRPMLFLFPVNGFPSKSYTCMIQRYLVMNNFVKYTCVPRNATLIHDNTIMYSIISIYTHTHVNVAPQFGNCKFNHTTVPERLMRSVCVQICASNIYSCANTYANMRVCARRYICMHTHVYVRKRIYKLPT